MHASMIPGKGIGQVAPYKALRRCGIDELAAHQFTATPSGGVLFARKPNDEHKTAAREAIVDLMSSQRLPSPATILTLPGLKWKFESMLLRAREPADFRESDGPSNTRFVCFENDRSIYHAAMLRMPGIANKHNLLRVLPADRFCERTLSSLFIDRYYFGNVDDYMQMANEGVDAAWLDYTGPMSIERRAVIRRFFEHKVSRLLVVTTLGARWNRQTSDAIGRHGGFDSWFCSAFDAELAHAIHYQDGPSPMVQIALRKPAP